MSHTRKTRSPISEFHSGQSQAAAPYQGLIPKVDGAACKISLSKYAALLGKLVLEKRVWLPRSPTVMGSEERPSGTLLRMFLLEDESEPDVGLHVCSTLCAGCSWQWAPTSDQSPKQFGNGCY